MNGELSFPLGSPVREGGGVGVSGGPAGGSRRA